MPNTKTLSVNDDLKVTCKRFWPLFFCTFLSLHNTNILSSLLPLNNPIICESFFDWFLEWVASTLQAWRILMPWLFCADLMLLSNNPRCHNLPSCRNFQAFQAAFMRVICIFFKIKVIVSFKAKPLFVCWIQAFKICCFRKPNSRIIAPFRIDFFPSFSAAFVFHPENPEQRVLLCKIKIKCFAILFFWVQAAQFPKHLEMFSVFLLQRQ